jgi:hypothetical protein
MSETISRRKFLIGATATLIVAPAIVRAASIMRIKPEKHPTVIGWDLAWPNSDKMIVVSDTGEIYIYNASTLLWSRPHHQIRYPYRSRISAA